MKRHHLLALLLLIAPVPAASPRAAGTIIGNVQIDHFSISPNGDGVADSMIITYDLADTATSVHVLILTSDSVTVVDSLLGGVPQGPSASHSVDWDGTFSDGTPVPEDSFLVFLRAVNAQASDSTYRKVTVDITTPQVIITNLFPNPFAPGSPDIGQSRLTIQYDVTDPAPSGAVTVRIKIFAPTGDSLETVADTLVAAVSTHVDTWDGAGATDDGIHEVRIEVLDQAGNRDVVFSSVDVDVQNPDVQITSLQANEDLRAIPDSLSGWAWDRNGIRSVSVRYSPSPTPFEPVTSTTTRMDTVFFTVQLVDSIVDQRSYTLGFRATDNLGRPRVIPFAITFDSIPPAAPVLDPPDGPSRSPTFVLDGTVSPDTDVMRIFRNSALLDTIFPNLPGGGGEFPYPFALVPGTNRVSALAVDKAGNESALSNEIVVVFDNSAGLFIAQPFVPNDNFQINLSRPAPRVTLRIYDLGGNLVQILYHTTSSANVTIPWDGRNGDNEAVKKGPLVAVARVEYQDGGSQVLRELFLFDP